MSLWRYRQILFTYINILDRLLGEPVRGVRCLIIFYDKEDEPIDIDVIQTDTWVSNPLIDQDPVILGPVIPGRLAIRCTSKVHSSVQKLTTRDDSTSPHTRVEFRILDFQIVEESEDGF
jgi:hypothetical protein